MASFTPPTLEDQQKMDKEAARLLKEAEAAQNVADRRARESKDSKFDASPMAEKERIRKSNKKYSLRKSQEKRVCTVCKKQLSGSNSKFCSVKCSNVHFDEIKRQKKIRESIVLHTNKIAELVRKLK